MNNSATKGPVRDGVIVYLNGTSSSGKTKLARDLHQILPGPWVNVEADHFFATLSHSEPWTVQPIVSAIHAFAATAAGSGVSVIVDGFLATRTWLKDAADQLAGQRAYLVAVRCSLDELERREAARGDRRVGNAREQYDFVHAHSTYDFEVDTSLSDSAACARLVAEWLVGWPEPVAFRWLRGSAYLEDESAYGWILTRASSGPAVQRLQNDLRTLGYDPGPTDGLFGEQTEAAVRSFQSAHDIRADGAVGWPRTLRAILDALDQSASDASDL